VESAPRAYRLKASNAAPPISTFAGAILVHREREAYADAFGDVPAIQHLAFDKLLDINFWG
jgi:hypothetical protein